MNRAPPLYGAITPLQLQAQLAELIAQGFGNAPILVYWEGAVADDCYKDCRGVALNAPTEYRPYTFLTVED